MSLWCLYVFNLLLTNSRQSEGKSKPLVNNEALQKEREHVRYILSIVFIYIVQLKIVFVFILWLTPHSCKIYIVFIIYDCIKIVRCRLMLYLFILIIQFILEGTKYTAWASVFLMMDTKLKW